jgi:predicted AAA+ superfamily ATPase
MGREYIRWQTEKTRKALKSRRVIAVSGARQTGKTTLSKQIIKDKGVYRSLDSEELLKLAKFDPNSFIKNKQGTMVIDEVQKVPSLLSEIKIAVDNNNRPGQYLLTGSANIQSLSTINDSLAGRISHIRLRPLTVGEILGKKPRFLEMAFKGDFPVQIKGFDKDTILDFAFRGGYPEVLRLKSDKERADWHLDYIDSLIKGDLQDIENIRRHDVVRDLIPILFGWSGKFMDKSRIGSGLEVSRQTLDIYINALILMFLFERVPSWIKSDYEIVKRKSKIYATDSGLMASILKWRREDLQLDSDKTGKLIETFVFQELSAQIDLDRDYFLTHYRDTKKREIDFIISKGDEGVVGIEVKSSKSFTQDDFSSLKWFKENIIKEKTAFRGIVLHTGIDTLHFGKDMLAVPMAALWS